MYTTDIRSVPFHKVVEEIDGYAILMLDREGRIQNWNKGAEAMLGYTAGEVTGGYFGIFHVADEVNGRKPEVLLRKAAERGKVYDEGWRLKKNGSVFWASVTIITISDEQGEGIGFIKFTRDLTRKRQAEQHLKKRVREIEVKNKELEQFAYIASHDLQEPLRTVISIVGLLKKQYEDQLGEPADTYLRFLLESTERMRSLIKGLLDYSRIGQNKELSPVNTGDLMKEVMADLDMTIRESGAQITVGEMPVMGAYRTEIRLLFQNLLSNAIKFRKTGVKPIISISAVGHSDHSWLFAFKDNGIGIEPKFRERIFMIFQRLNTRTEYEGTGIGLSHCRKIVELHQGRIWVDSNPEGGSIFYFTLFNINEDETKTGIHTDH